MNPEARACVAGAFGVLVIRLVQSGGHRAYVRPRMGPLLLLAGMALAGVAMVLTWASSRALRSGGPMEARGHTGGSPLHLLLVGLLVMLAVIPPVPLGAAAAAMRWAGGPSPPVAALPTLPPPVGGAVPMTVSEFVGRALFDEHASLRGVRVRLVGFVAAGHARAPGSFVLVRFAMFCCAADAVPMRVLVLGAGAAPAPDSWVEVVGVWRPAPPQPPGRFNPAMTPVLDSMTVRSTEEPADPYDPPL